MSAAPGTWTTAVQSPPDALTLFTARCEARALLWTWGEILDLHEAVDALQEHAELYGLVRQIDHDAVQRIISDAFRPVRAGEGP